MTLIVTLVALSVFGVRGFGQAGENSAQDLQYKAVSEAESGHFEEARKYYLQEVELLEATGKYTEAGAVYTDLGEFTQIHGAFSAAETSYKKGLALLDRYAQPDDLRLLAALDDLGWLYVTWGRLTEGSRLIDEARKKADQAVSNDARLIRHLDTQAAYQTVVGRYSDAQKSWNRALEIGKINYGPDAPQYDSILVHFGQASTLFGDYAVAEQMLRRYLAVEQRTGTSITAHALVAGELAHVYTELHKYSEAETWFNEATDILIRNPGRAPLVYSMILSYLGDFYMDQEDWSRAAPQYREALRIEQEVLGDSRAVAASMISLAKALKKTHAKSEARGLEARAKEILDSKKNWFGDQTVDVMALRRQ